MAQSVELLQSTVGIEFSYKDAITAATRLQHTDLASSHLAYKDPWADFAPGVASTLTEAHAGRGYNMGRPQGQPPCTKAAVVHTYLLPGVCRYWSEGRCCKALQQQRCGLRHPELWNGRDMLHTHLCHRFLRDSCTEGTSCRKWHMTRAQFRSLHSEYPQCISEDRVVGDDTGDDRVSEVSSQSVPPTPCTPTQTTLDPGVVLSNMLAEALHGKTAADRLLMANQWKKVFEPAVWKEVQPVRLRLLVNSLWICASGHAGAAEAAITVHGGDGCTSSSTTSGAV